MADFVNAVSSGAFRSERYELLSALAADAGRTTTPGPERNKIILIGPLDESHGRLCFPMCNRVRDPLLVGQVLVDREGKQFIFPAKPKLLDAGAKHFQIALCRLRI